jgi:hypothetical protein
MKTVPTGNNTGQNETNELLPYLSHTLTSGHGRHPRLRRRLQNGGGAIPRRPSWNAASPISFCLPRQIAHPVGEGDLAFCGAPPRASRLRGEGSGRGGTGMGGAGAHLRREAAGSGPCGGAAAGPPHSPALVTSWYFRLIDWWRQ